MVRFCLVNVCIFLYDSISLITANWFIRFDSNFGKLNYFLGKRAADDGRESRYPDIDFCKDPGECLEWYRIYYFVIDPDVVPTYNSNGFIAIRCRGDMFESGALWVEMDWWDICLLIRPRHAFSVPVLNGLLLSLVSCHSWILLLDKWSSILWRRRLELYQRATQLCRWRYGGRCIHQCCVRNRQ